MLAGTVETSRTASTNVRDCSCSCPSCFLFAFIPSLLPPSYLFYLLLFLIVVVVAAAAAALILVSLPPPPPPPSPPPLFSYSLHALHVSVNVMVLLLTW